MNRIHLSGRLVRDPDVRIKKVEERDLMVANYALAVNRRFKREGQPEADFFDLTSFGSQAEFVNKYLKKGTKIIVTGSVQTGIYTNKDGIRMPSFKIIPDEIEFAESKRGNNEGAEPSDKEDTVFEGAPEDLPLEEMGDIAANEAMLDEENPFG